MNTDQEFWPRINAKERESIFAEQSKGSNQQRAKVAVPKNKKPRVLWLTHSPRPAVRYRPLPTSLLCLSFLRNPQSAIFNQLALQLGLRAYRQPGKSVNTSGLLSLPLNISRSPQPAVR